MALLTTTLEAQSWNDPATRALVDRAIRERTAATADTSLRSYTARAHGVLTFEAAFDERLALGSRLVKGDELDVEVYWERPDRSKQVIRAWRDSTFFPTDLRYHRDHLGIVSNDFGPLIRIGDGDEVRDVPHPLGPDGPDRYDYRAGDTLSIASAGSVVRLVAVLVRPRRPDLPAVAGTLYLDRDRAALVRFAFSFTPAAYVDRDLEDISVRLERALIDGYWLPWRQAIEIRRRGAVLDWPLRGVIRGRWEIGDHRLNADSPLAGPGSWILGLRSPGGPPWPEPLLATLDSAAALRTAPPLEEVRATARRLLRRRVVDGLPRFRLAVSRASDLLRLTRVEGTRFGLGVRWQGAGFDAIEGGFGVASADGRLTGRLRLVRNAGRAAIAVAAERSVTDVADEPPVSGPVNSLAAAVGGRDLGDYLLLDRIALSVRRSDPGGTSFEVSAGREWAGSLAARGRPWFGRWRANPPLGGPPAWVARAGFGWDRGRSRSVRGAVGAEVGVGDSSWGRLDGRVEAEWPGAGGAWRLALQAGVATAGVPARRSFQAGGPGTLLGEPFRAFGGRALLVVRAERLWSVPGPTVGLGPFGRTGPTMLVGPFAAAGGAFGSVPGPWQPGQGLRPVAGLAAELFDRTLRIEVGQALRGGRGPQVNVDVVKRWWPIL